MKKENFKSFISLNFSRIFHALLELRTRPLEDTFLTPNYNCKSWVTCYILNITYHILVKKCQLPLAFAKLLWNQISSWCYLVPLTYWFSICHMSSFQFASADVSDLPQIHHRFSKDTLNYIWFCVSMINLWQFGHLWSEDRYLRCCF